MLYRINNGEGKYTRSCMIWVRIHWRMGEARRTCTLPAVVAKPVFDVKPAFDVSEFWMLTFSQNVRLPPRIHIGLFMRLAHHNTQILDIIVN